MTGSLDAMNARREQGTASHVSLFSLGAGDLQRIVAQRRYGYRRGGERHAGECHEHERHEAFDEQLPVARANRERHGRTVCGVRLRRVIRIVRVTSWRGGWPFTHHDR